MGAMIFLFINHNHNHNHNQVLFDKNSTFTENIKVENENELTTYNLYRYFQSDYSYENIWNIHNTIYFHEHMVQHSYMFKII